jgi:hypothetical protein
MIKGLFFSIPSLTHLSSLISVTKIGMTMNMPENEGEITHFRHILNSIKCSKQVFLLLVIIEKHPTFYARKIFCHIIHTRGDMFLK